MCIHKNLSCKEEGGKIRPTLAPSSIKFGLAGAPTVVLGGGSLPKKIVFDVAKFMLDARTALSNDVSTMPHMGLNDAPPRRRP